MPSTEEWEWSSIEGSGSYVLTTAWRPFCSYSLPSTLNTIHKHPWHIVHEDERLIVAVSPREVRILLMRRLAKEE